MGFGARLRGLIVAGERASHPKGGSLQNSRSSDRGSGGLKAGFAGRFFRPVTLGLILVFATTAYYGAQIVAFMHFEDQVAAARAAPYKGQRQPKDSLLGAVSAWTDTAAVATRARNLRFELTLVEMPDNISAIAHAVGDIAEASPTSSGAWQTLAQLRSARRNSMENVLTAFRMSALTGSHEGHVMKQRAIFGLEHWAEMPEGDRDTVVRDLLATARLPEYRTDDYRAVIALKSQEERDNIRAAFTASWLANQALVQALGL